MSNGYLDRELLKKAMEKFGLVTPDQLAAAQGGMPPAGAMPAGAPPIPPEAMAAMMASMGGMPPAGPAGPMPPMAPPGAMPPEAGGAVPPEAVVPPEVLDAIKQAVKEAIQEGGAAKGGEGKGKTSELEEIKNRLSSLEDLVGSLVNALGMMQQTPGI